jgi:uncharacterized protein YbjT (DUF2867 family)
MPQQPEARAMILVTGATGRVGYHLMEALADARADATAMVRVEARGADLPGPGKHIVASFDDPPPPDVLQDFDRVFLLSPATEEQAELEIRFIDALVTAGHRPHVVKIAADGFADPDCDVRFMRSHRTVAVHLGATGLPVSYLAPVWYLENLLDAAETIRREATLYAPAGRSRVAFIAASDVADVAARVLASSGRGDATYVLTGPEALGYGELASGMTPWQVEGMLEMFEWIRGGGTDSVTSDVADVTGQAARPAEDWLSEFRAVFLSPPLDVPPPGI